VFNSPKGGETAGADPGQLTLSREAKGFKVPEKALGSAVNGLQRVGQPRSGLKRRV
jgi:hypothetical protein